MGRDIFKKRVNIKPVEYPEFLPYVDAIRHSYWVHTEFNVTSDIQDYYVNLTMKEKEVLKRTILSISQVEVNVKRFWGNLYNYIPKPEIDDVGGTFAESEVRHKDAYSFLLEQLGLNEDFEKIYEIPAIIDRVAYLEKVGTILKSEDMAYNRRVLQAVVIFSLFIEHVSLFGQFLIVMSYNKHKNMLKGISNIVEATSKEEQIHGMFGIEVFNVIKDEYPDLIDEEFLGEVLVLCQKAALAERKILEWIFEEGDLDFISRKTVENYVFSRFNKSLKELGLDMDISTVDVALLEETKWFDEEILSTKENDFFSKRSVDYSKNQKPVTEHDLF